LLQLAIGVSLCDEVDEVLDLRHTLGREATDLLELFAVLKLGVLREPVSLKSGVGPCDVRSLSPTAPQLTANGRPF
jgi:hypothetical protein